MWSPTCPSVGPATILDAVSRLSWRLAIVLCFPYALTATLDTAAWRFAFPRRVPPFAKLWARASPARR